MSGFRIRPASTDDLAVLPQIEEAAGRLFAQYGGGEADDSNVTGDLGLSSAAARDGRLWVATNGAEVVGFALVTIVDEEAHLHEMDVRPEFGRLGLGRALMSTVE